MSNFCAATRFHEAALSIAVPVTSQLKRKRPLLLFLSIFRVSELGTAQRRNGEMEQAIRFRWAQ